MTSRTGDLSHASGRGHDHKPTERAGEYARAFLSGLFMAQRTAQFHAAHNKAYENAIQTVHTTGGALFAATGGFQIIFVGDTTILNGSRLRIDGASFAAIRSLRQVLEAREIGGLVVSSPPTYESSRALVAMLSKQGAVTAEDLAAAGITTLAIQHFQEDEKEVRIDRRIMAVQAYAKLLIALHDQFEAGAASADASGGNQRIRAVRVVQDLIELAEDRPDFVLLLALNRSGHWPAEVYGVDVSLLSVSLGHALGLDRAALVDLGMAGLVHHLGIRGGHESPGELDRGGRQLSLARLLHASGVGRSTMRRAVAVAEQRRPYEIPDGWGKRGRPHLHARIVSLTTTFCQLLTGTGLKQPLKANPIDVLALLQADKTQRFDPDLVDLLINVLRAFPVGSSVVLDTGERGFVSTHAGSRRWDRPVVTVTSGGKRRNVDMMVREGDRFPHRIEGTTRFLGLEETSGTLPVPPEATRPHPSLSRDLPRLTTKDADAPPIKKASAEDLFKEFLDDGES